MSPTRRTAIKSVGVASGLAAIPGTVYARGEHEDDEREKKRNEKPDEKKKNDEPPMEPPTGGVRVAHLSPDAPNVDVFVDDQRVLADVPYGDISPYLELEPGTYRVQITAADDPDAIVYDEQVSVEDAFYTLAAIGELEANTFEVLVLTDAGSAVVRLVHASPDAPAVDVSAAGQPLFENVAFGEASDYIAVPAGDYTLEISPAGDQETVVAAVDVTLELATPYTAFATGYLEPPADLEDRAFEVLLTPDGPAAIEAETPAQAN
ncbi:DUF4397 family protein [Natrialba magadii ATCC 43099]|uniref:DUF4397 family protein n=1 Tax=Natrialba magadii (strain ATCC 43099 / DSM 3394 / CCM 3739 / CIP 104546 / IAM 13178 / JCM 8861 / NBRC 102185 / NCIMB 2190 / MS3) TaxID=547559 RepID=D3SYS3_NATMM|nr:DUF4397 domain-containing protein [Natrialba magadii]ADD04184.1 DUF4397 family protein [Natrialba magadii ATCC 43099]ELY26589.1 hypothetical protein C500_15540 [Natrialba magadii ATCC 43099]